MSDRTPTMLVEELASAVIMAEPSDAEALRHLAMLLDELRASAGPELQEEIASCQEKLHNVQQRSTEDVDAELRDLADGISRLQNTAAGVPAASAGTLVLPPYVEESIFREFLGGQSAALDEIEAATMALEKGGSIAELRRRLHTLKGEAGVVGLEELQQVYHALEDFLDAAAHPSERVDRVLQAKDWIAGALKAYADLRLPSPSAQQIIAQLHAPSSAETTAAAPPAPATAASVAVVAAPPAPVAPAPVAPAPVAPASVQPAAPEAPEAGQRVERDDETISLMAEFLQESNEGLARADQILMNIEHDGLTSEMVNGLFRVFHSIKGVAGFLDLKEITSVGHTTETLLNLVRQNTLELKGVALDLVFDATESMRRLLDGVRHAVDASESIPAAPEVAELLTNLRAVIDGRPVTPPEAAPAQPALQPGAKLGEILEKTAGVQREVIEAAIVSQAESGRRLGEELVAQGAVQPKQVAQALRVQSQADGAGKIKETIKVDLDRVDSMVEMIGELVIVESMVINMPEITAISSHRARNYLGQLTKITRDLQSVGMSMRMVPVRGVFQKMSRLVRDLSRKSGKQVRIVLSGEGTEMDRSMVEQIADPLVHMIRNAVDHGLESTEDRVLAGKPAMGVIYLSAYHEGGSILIEISDDGKGLNREAILAKARAQGLVREGQSLTDTEVNELIFAPGFSTAKEVTEISGRGVGMDVVKRNIESMRGRVFISTEPGRGTNFKLILPLTLAIIDGMLVSCGDERYIIPTLSIIESIQPDPSMLFSFAEKHEMINVRGEILPLLRLDRLFNIKDAKPDPTTALVVVLESLGRKIGLLVDDVLTQQQVVIKTLGAGLNGTRFVSGAAILSDGKVGLILNVEEIGSYLGEQSRAARQAAATTSGPRATARAGAA
jgi:two-component system, chemotaxis family, sensor kinase CheA